MAPVSEVDPERQPSVPATAEVPEAPEIPPAGIAFFRPRLWIPAAAVIVALLIGAWAWFRPTKPAAPAMAQSVMTPPMNTGAPPVPAPALAARSVEREATPSQPLAVEVSPAPGVQPDPPAEPAPPTTPPRFLVLSGSPVPLDSQPNGELVAVLEAGRVERTDQNPILVGPLEWIEIDVSGWMAAGNVVSQEVNLAVEGTTGRVVWDGGGNPDDAFLSLRDQPAAGALRLGKVPTGTRLRVDPSSPARVVGSHRWVKVGLTGWIPVSALTPRDSGAPPPIASSVVPDGELSIETGGDGISRILLPGSDQPFWTDEGDLRGQMGLRSVHRAVGFPYAAGISSARHIGDQLHVRILKRGAWIAVPQDLGVLEDFITLAGWEGAGTFDPHQTVELLGFSSSGNLIYRIDSEAWGAPVTVETSVTKGPVAIWKGQRSSSLTAMDRVAFLLALERSLERSGKWAGCAGCFAPTADYFGKSFTRGQIAADKKDSALRTKVIVNQVTDPAAVVTRADGRLGVNYRTAFHLIIDGKPSKGSIDYAAILAPDGDGNLQITGYAARVHRQ
ncbi:hypothetical protein Hsar01_00608 [Haloferula sargassicola]|uniref:SH3 domain-containing protein n=2 Tax=Haloferula sargassicola TaxID=490096 RepID=A0ABP9UPZ9_9BACT